MNQQLHLPLDHGRAIGDRPCPCACASRMATDGGQPFDDDGCFFEPWWPGTQAFLRRGGDQSSSSAPSTSSDPLTIFPELRTASPD